MPFGHLRLFGEDTARHAAPRARQFHALAQIR
jgi:hypothetical protein